MSLIVSNPSPGKDIGPEKELYWGEPCCNPMIHREKALGVGEGADDCVSLPLFLYNPSMDIFTVDSTINGQIETSTKSNLRTEIPE